MTMSHKADHYYRFRVLHRVNSDTGRKKRRRKGDRKREEEKKERERVLECIGRVRNIYKYL